MVPEFDNTEVAFNYRTDKDLKKARFLFSSMGSPVLTAIGMKATKWSMALGLPIKGIIKSTIFSQFCGGESMEEAAKTANILEKYNIGIILDYGVEGKENEHDFDKAVPEFIKAIRYAASQKNIPFISVKITGFARFALLEKLHAGTSLTQQENEEWLRVKQRINDICMVAHKTGTMVLIDAEESWVQKPVDELTDAMMEAYNKDKAIIFNTFQMYRHDRLVFLKQSYKKATDKGYLLGAKLVRGAYMEKERAHAIAGGYPSPIQPDKECTDRDYDAAVIFCLDHIARLALFIGTHNEKVAWKPPATCRHMIYQLIQTAYIFHSYTV